MYVLFIIVILFIFILIFMHENLCDVIHENQYEIPTL